MGGIDHVVIVFGDESPGPIEGMNSIASLGKAGDQIGGERPHGDRPHPISGLPVNGRDLEGDDLCGGVEPHNPSGDGATVAQGKIDPSHGLPDTNIDRRGVLPLQLIVIVLGDQHQTGILSIDPVGARR